MTDGAFYKYIVGDKVVKLFYDEPCCPFEEEFEQSEGDAVITCSFYHTRSSLPLVNVFDDVKEMQEYHKSHPEYELFRLMRYEHGAVSFRAFGLDQQPEYPFNCQWDAGMEGFVLAKPTKKDEFYEGCPSATAIDRANNHLEYLTDWCNGETFRYVIEDEDGNELNSCGGFTGHEHAKQSAIEAAYHHIEDPTEVKEIVDAS